jgi:hypothetical protein
MNHIEHAWELIGRKINQRNPKCKNIDELRIVVVLNEVFRWRQTLARPSVGRNKKRLSSDQWTRLHVRIVHPK